MTVTVLLENRLSADTNLKLKTAPGLSIHIETDNSKILLDAGPDGKFADNADAMGIEIARVDQMVISHAHSDHGGGLARFLTLNETAEVLIHEAAVHRYYTKVFNTIPVGIGLNRRLLEQNAARIQYITGDLTLSDGLSIITDYPENFPRPHSNHVLFMRDGKRLIPDRFRHEILLLVEEPGGYVLFTACSHSGLINIVDRAMEKIVESGSKKKLKAVFGGFHLHNPIGGKSESLDYLEKLAHAMDRYETVFYTGHCTGETAFKVLTDRLEDKVKSMNTGDVFVI